MKKLSKEERKNRIIARGEHSNHSHVIVGDASVTRNDKGEILVKIGKEGAVLKHLLESEWMNGIELWTKEHKDIPLKEMPKQVRHGDVLLDKINETTYRFIQQVQYSPYDKMIQQVKD